MRRKSVICSTYCLRNLRSRILALEVLLREWKLHIPAMVSRSPNANMCWRETGMSGCKPVETPMDPNIKSEACGEGIPMDG